ncbi:hypothetical protein ACP0JT_28815, partial [Pseudomonas aeruginosa]
HKQPLAEGLVRSGRRSIASLRPGSIHAIRGESISITEWIRSTNGKIGLLTVPIAPSARSSSVATSNPAHPGKLLREDVLSALRLSTKRLQVSQDVMEQV